MSNSLTRPEWQQECLLAANHQLEKSYQQKPSACLALLISRNYRLLLTQSERSDSKRRWQQLSKRWWQNYCRQRPVSAFSLKDVSIP